MQTFLPYPDFERSARCLDDRRLGKQRVEARQILNILLGRAKGRGWIHHPAVKMWRGYENALKEYYNAILTEWIRRGFENNMEFEDVDGEVELPYWLGGGIHASHRSSLLRKDPVFYGRYDWKEEPSLPYVWPEGKT
ncbi:MAG: MSMEG_6728 family protein [Candidatus Zixiibacteriota bacterium]